MTINEDIYLKDEYYSYFYTPNDKNMFLHKHINCLSNFNINRMRNRHYLYRIGTFITMKDYY